MKRVDENKASERELIEGKERKHYETVYLKFPGKRVEDITEIEGPVITQTNPDKVDKLIRDNTGKRARFTHNHPTYPFIPVFGGPIPSPSDFKVFIGEKVLRTMTVAQNNPLSGKVEGYCVVRKTGKTPNEAKLNELKAYLLEMPLALGIRAPYLNYLSRRFDLKYRFVPAEGYKLNGHGTRFVPVHKKGLENRTQQSAITAIVLSLALGSLFLLSNITGFAISDLTKTTLNWIGAISFIVGVIGAFIYFKKR